MISDIDNIESASDEDLIMYGKMIMAECKNDNDRMVAYLVVMGIDWELKRRKEVKG